MAIGSALAEKKELVPKKQRSTGQALNPEGGRSRIGDLLKNPAVVTMIMQGLASMGAGRGFGQSMADATAAAGRGMTKLAEQETAQEKEDRRRFESDREFELRRMQVLGLGGGGGGGGGSGGGGSGGGGSTLVKEDEMFKYLMKQAEDEYDRSLEGIGPGDAAPTPPNPAMIRYEARRITTAANSGMPMKELDEILKSGNQDAADAYIDAYSKGETPEERKRNGDSWRGGILDWRPTPEPSPQVPTGGGGMVPPLTTPSTPSMGTSGLPPFPVLPGPTAPLPPSGVPSANLPLTEEQERRRRANPFGSIMGIGQ